MQTVLFNQSYLLFIFLLSLQKYQSSVTQHCSYFVLLCNNLVLALILLLELRPGESKCMAGFMENQVKEYFRYVLGIRVGNEVLHQWGNKCVAVITDCNSSVCWCWNTSLHYCSLLFFFLRLNLSVYEMCSTVIKMPEIFVGCWGF